MDFSSTIYLPLGGKMKTSKCILFCLAFMYVLQFSFVYGQPLFSDTTNYVVGNQPVDLEVADFNGDGYVDIVVANYGEDLSSCQ
jgi:hypothetical protein